MTTHQEPQIEHWRSRINDKSWTDEEVVLTNKEKEKVFRVFNPSKGLVFDPETKRLIRMRAYEKKYSWFMMAMCDGCKTGYSGRNFWQANGWEHSLCSNCTRIRLGAG